MDWYTFKATGTLDDDHRIALQSNGRARNLESGMLVQIVENQIIKLGSGTTVEVMANTDSNFEGDAFNSIYKHLKIDKDGTYSSSNGVDYSPIKDVLPHYQLRYKAENDTSYTILTQSDDPELAWNAYSVLNIKSGPYTPQKLSREHNHSITLTYGEPSPYTGQYSEASISYSENDLNDDEKGKSNFDLYLQTNYTLNLAGGENIDLTAIDSNGDEYFATAMSYKMSNTDVSENLTVVKDGDGYLVELDKAFSDNTATFKIPLSFLEAKSSEDGSGVILPFRIVHSNYESWSMELHKGADTSGDLIYPIGYDVTTNYKQGIYYVKFEENNLDEMNITITLPTIAGMTESPSMTIALLPPFSYVYNDKIGVAQKDLESKVVDLDTDHIFDYTYVPISDNEIMSPLDSKTFFNKSHFCNAFVIPQISSIKIKTMNKRG